MPPPVTDADQNVKAEIITYLQKVPFARAVTQPDFQALLDADQRDPLFPPDAREAFAEATEVRNAKRVNPMAGAFFSNKSVVIVPGFMGSQLRDTDDPAGGLVWIDPTLYFTSSKDDSELSKLRLKKFQHGNKDEDMSGVKISEYGAVPVLYAGLKYYLESGRCEVRTAGFDWRKNIDESAELVAAKILGYAAEYPSRPLFVIAHSQGSLVARRALQHMGKDEARRIVNRLILLGPASYGTFSAAFALAGNHEMFASLTHYGLEWPSDINDVMRSMSGLYQLLPWRKRSELRRVLAQLGRESKAMEDPGVMKDQAIWRGHVDKERLDEYFGWGRSVDTEFFNDRTSIILGDDGTPNDSETGRTPSAVAFENGVLTTKAWSQGDGTVPDEYAVLDGVTDLARAPGADHMTLPLNRVVMQTVWRMISANINAAGLAGPSKRNFEAKDNASDVDRREPVRILPPATDLFKLAGVSKSKPRRLTKGLGQPKSTDSGAPISGSAGPGSDTRVAAAGVTGLLADLPPVPKYRRLKVFSFDPLLATDPSAMGIESLTLRLPWDDESEDGSWLQPGPRGEYLEVVDYDPASRCFYPPVNLNHPNLLAQDGMPLSETEPRFHQQMVYAVAMTTITLFERALGRSVQWSQVIQRDANGNVQQGVDGKAEVFFIRRLRIYPHALREANAYYDPTRKALLFGYFPAKAKPGDKVLPKGTVFTCLSYDVIAHETTHAILDGMHRYFMDPSNPDVLAFHEAFADIVALFQHFGHPEVVTSQIAKTGGMLDSEENMLGRLAQQFGEAMGLHGSLREYLGTFEKDRKGSDVWVPIKPDPKLYESTTEPHDRGALLVAAMFTAYQTIYKRRTRDLMGFASVGRNANGDLHPDLVNRLADEAAKSARHLLTVAIRALDYVPPVDVNFGDYLRALVTSDFDIQPTDSHFYRVAIVDAFRQWGIYPTHVKTLSVDSLLWGVPGRHAMSLDLGKFREIGTIGSGNLKMDRADMYHRQKELQRDLHEWFRDRFIENPALAREWGLCVEASAPKTIRRDNRPELAVKSLPKFEIHSLRRCRRIGSDDQERLDVLVEIVQRRDGYLDKSKQDLADAGNPPREGPDFIFRGGATLIVDPRAGRIRYAIRKSIASEDRLEAVRDYMGSAGSALGLRGNYFRRGSRDNPFPFLHASED